MIPKLAFWCVFAVATVQAAAPAKWQNDLTPIAASDWNYDFAAHLLERAGFRRHPGGN